MTFIPCRSAGKDRIKPRGSASSPNQRAYRVRQRACQRWNQERPLGLASLLLPPIRHTHSLRPIRLIFTAPIDFSARRWVERVS
jgi:hypothetical protein